MYSFLKAFLVPMKLLSLSRFYAPKNTISKLLTFISHAEVHQPRVKWFHLHRTCYKQMFTSQRALTKLLNRAESSLENTVNLRNDDPISASFELNAALPSRSKLVANMPSLLT